MIGDKYREPGDRRTIRVRAHEEAAKRGLERYKIFQGNEVYSGYVGSKSVGEKEWMTEAEAQSYLDLLAKARNWKKVSR